MPARQIVEFVQAQRYFARMKKHIPKRNRSPHGWWIATTVERLEYLELECFHDVRGILLCDKRLKVAKD